MKKEKKEKEEKKEKKEKQEKQEKHLVQLFLVLIPFPLRVPVGILGTFEPIPCVQKLFAQGAFSLLSLLSYGSSIGISIPGRLWQSFA